MLVLLILLWVCGTVFCSAVVLQHWSYRGKSFERFERLYVGAGIVYVTDQIPRITMYAPDGTLLARGRPVTMGAHGVWGDSRGNLYLAEMAVNQVTKLVRRQRAPGA